MIQKGYVILAAYQCGSGFWYTQAKTLDLRVRMLRMGADRGISSYFRSPTNTSLKFVKLVSDTV